MKQGKRLTRTEKIAQSAAARKGIVALRRHLIGLPPGEYRLVGEAAEEVNRFYTKTYSVLLGPGR